MNAVKRRLMSMRPNADFGLHAGAANKDYIWIMFGLCLDYI
jgi:hypothetical protein